MPLATRLPVLSFVCAAIAAASGCQTAARCDGSHADLAATDALADGPASGADLADGGGSPILADLATSPDLAPTPLPEGTVVFADEFDGAQGTGPDATKWTFDTGGGGWGNSELEDYTPSTDNARLDGSGHLEIVARTASTGSCWYGTCQYTSARLLTKGLFAERYGRIEARVQVPSGQGLWPAFWMLGANIDQAGWPACGEIDVMENLGSQPFTVHGSAHGPGYSGANPLTAAYVLPGAAPLAADFHVFTVEWDPHALRFYVDGALYESRSPTDLPQGATWVYDHPFFLILNLAVGGTWPGSPSMATVFPATMRVDWVRVFEPYESPFLGVPATVPGVIQAEDFDYGGEGSAYHSTTNTNEGGLYRVLDDTVGIGASYDVDGGYAVGWTAAGEWLRYTVSVAQAKSYTLEARVSSMGAGGTFHVEANGADVTGPMTVPDTGAWTTWQTIVKPNVVLPAGPVRLRLVMDANGATGGIGNINWLRLR